MWTDLKPMDLDKIKTVDFPLEHYGKEVYSKTQIVIHHTVSGPGIRGDIAQWLLTANRIGTCIIVERDGTPDQCFPSRLWAGHLGAGNINLDFHSIGVELDNWGGLIKGDGEIHVFGKNGDGSPRKVKTVDGKYYAVYGNQVDVPMTYYETPWRGYNYYESYTNEQIQTLGELILLWKNRYKIPMTYNDDMWDVSKRALSGEPGIWSHVSFRPYPQKSDAHPQPELIEMLKSLK